MAFSRHLAKILYTGLFLKMHYYSKLKCVLCHILNLKYFKDTNSYHLDSSLQNGTSLRIYRYFQCPQFWSPKKLNNQDVGCKACLTIEVIYLGLKYYYDIMRKWSASL